MQRHEHRQAAYAINKHNHIGWLALAVVFIGYFFIGALEHIA